MEAKAKGCSLRAHAQVLCSATLLPRSDLSASESELHRRRSGVQRIDWICGTHKNAILALYPLHQKVCCDPFALHKVSVKKSLREVTLDFTKECSDCRVFSSPLIPGKKLCTNCFRNCQTRIDTFKESLESFMDQSAPHEVPALHAVAWLLLQSDSSVNQHLPDKHILTPEGYDEVFPTPPDVALSDLNKCLTMFGLDPLDPKLMSGKNIY